MLCKSLVLFSLFFIVNSCNKEDNSTVINYDEAKASLFSNLKNIISSKSEATFKNAVNPSFTEAEKLSILDNSIAVLNSQGITKAMIVEEFGSLNHPEIVSTALAVTRIVDGINAGNRVVDLETGFCFSTNTYSTLSYSDSPDNLVIDCALIALGIKGGFILYEAKGQSTVSALLKAAGRLATRALGWIGAAVAVYAFGDCMDWW